MRPFFFWAPFRKCCLPLYFSAGLKGLKVPISRDFSAIFEAAEGFASHRIHAILEG